MEQKRSFFSLIIWGVMFIVFIPIFFSGGGPETWIADDRRAIVAAVIFLFGFLAYFIVMGMTRGRDEKDERDRLIQGKACKTALILALLYVYLLNIILYEIYHDANAVPAGWMWFVAYSTVFIGTITASTASLIYYRKGIKKV